MEHGGRETTAGGGGPRRCGVILIQECTYPQEMNFWQGDGYTFFIRESDKKERGNATAIRQDIMQNLKFEVRIQEKHCHMATFKRTRGESKLWTPPRSQHHNIRAVEYLAQMTDNDFGGGDLNWLGTNPCRRPSRPSTAARRPPPARRTSRSGNNNSGAHGRSR